MGFYNNYSNRNVNQTCLTYNITNFVGFFQCSGHPQRLRENLRLRNIQRAQWQKYKDVIRWHSRLDGARGDKKWACVWKSRHLVSSEILQAQDYIIYNHLLMFLWWDSLLVCCRSFGVVLWELLTGEIPYKDVDSSAIIWGVGSNSLHLPVPSTCPDGFKILMKQTWWYIKCMFSLCLILSCNITVKLFECFGQMWITDNTELLKSALSHSPGCPHYQARQAQK